MAPPGDCDADGHLIEGAACARCGLSAAEIVDGLEQMVRGLAAGPGAAMPHT
jgi:hypothetical protein